MKRISRTISHQRGATLIIALIMLVALALLAVWGFNTSTVNLRVVGNTQARQEAFVAGQTALEKTISSPLFIQQAAAVAASPIAIDLDNDGASDYDARLSPAPSCYRVRVLKVNELDPSAAGDLSCMGSSASGSVIEVEGEAPTTGDSLCADSDWNVRAVVVDTRSNASLAMNQGVSVRSLSTDTANACP